MCPEAQTLSAYFDGELEEPHKSVIEEHIRQCHHCQEKLASFSTVRENMLFEKKVIDYEKSKDRVWSNLHTFLQNEPSHPHFWQRRVILPMPAVIGFALIIFLFLGGFILVLQRQTDYNNQVMTASSIRRSQKEAEMRDLETVTQYFETQNDIIEVKMQLPKKSRFIVGGEPRLIRVDEFNELKQ